MKRNLLPPTSIERDAQKRYEELLRTCAQLEPIVAQYPEGKIHIVKSNNRIQYYLRLTGEEKSGSYIHKHEQRKTAIYLQKRYDEEAFRLMKEELSNLERFLKKSRSYSQKLEELYTTYPEESRNCILPIAISDAEYVRAWQNAPFEAKAINPQLPTYITERGEHVRSKSELNIANKLFREGIPYKYECPLVLSDGRRIYPDFTILDVKKRREIYWEHRGMMDDREYCRHSVQRLKDYYQERIVVGDRLFLTEETMMSPLGTDEIEQIIKLLRTNGCGESC